MAAISISILSDTKQAVNSVKSLGEGIDNVVQQLKDLGPEGAASAEQLEAGLKGAQEASQKSAQAAKDLAVQVSKAEAELRAAGKYDGGSLIQALNETTSTTRAAGGAVEDLAEDKLGKLKEGLSFNASFAIPEVVEGLGEGGLTGALGTAGSAISGMGMMLEPEFMLPMLAAGSVVTLITSYFQKQQEAAEADQEAIAKMAGSLVSSFVQAHAAGEDLGKAFEDWVQHADEYGISLSDLQKDVTGTGISFSDVAKSIVSDNVPALKQYRDELTKQTAQAQKVVDAYESQGQAESGIVEQNGYLFSSMNKTNDVSEKAFAAAKKQISGNKDLTDALDKRIKAEKEAADDEKAVAAAMGFTVKQYEAAEKKINSLTDAYSDAKDAYDGMQSSLSSDAASVGSDLDDILDRSKKDADAILKTQQQEIDANKRFMTDWNAAVQAGLDANGQNWVASNRASFQEVVDTYGIGSPQAKQMIANANALGAQSSSDWSKQFTTGVENAMVQAQQTLANTKLLVKLGLDTSGLSSDTIASIVRALKVPSVFVPVIPSKLGRSLVGG